MVERRVRLKPGLWESYLITLMTYCEPQLFARSRAHVKARDGTLASRCRRDVTDGALGGSAEGQGARATSIGGYFGVYTVSIHPYTAFGSLRPVTEATPGRQGRFVNPGPIVWDQVRKGVKVIL